MPLKRISFLARFTLAIWILTLCQNSSAECADASNSKPAKPLSSAQQQSQLKRIAQLLPRNSQAQSINFSLRVDRTGKPDHLCCFSAPFDQNNRLQETMEKQLELLRFEPAIHQGNPVAVFAHLTLQIANTGDGVTAELFMRQPLANDKLGADYLSPQRLAPRSLWSSGTGLKVHSSTRPMWGDIRVNVQRDGTASSADVGKIRKGSKRIFRQFARKLKRQCFIPGFYNGKAVEMPFVEVFHN